MNNHTYRTHKGRVTHYPTINDIVVSRLKNEGIRLSHGLKCNNGDFELRDTNDISKRIPLRAEYKCQKCLDDNWTCNEVHCILTTNKVNMTFEVSVYNQRCSTGYHMIEGTIDYELYIDRIFNTILLVFIDKENISKENANKVKTLTSKSYYHDNCIDCKNGIHCYGGEV